MQKSLPFIIIIAVLVIALGAGLFLWKRSGATTSNTDSTFATNVTGTAPTGSSSTQAQRQPPDTDGATRPNVKVSSPVVLEEYGDYQCPPCGQLYPELKEIEKEYGNQVQIVFHHFPLMKIHKNALVAAHAAEAARNQNKFWEMHDRLYRNQKEWSELADPGPVFIDYAKQLGLKIDEFTSDLGSNMIDQRISADIQRGSADRGYRPPTVLLESLAVDYPATHL